MVIVLPSFRDNVGGGQDDLSGSLAGDPVLVCTDATGGMSPARRRCRIRVLGHAHVFDAIDDRFRPADHIDSTRCRVRVGNNHAMIDELKRLVVSQLIHQTDGEQGTTGAVVEVDEHAHADAVID